VAGLCVVALAPVGRASEIRGTVQGGDALTPAPRPAPSGQFRASYWDAPNGNVTVTAPRASLEYDLGVVLTGPGIEDATRPVPLRIEGGRCRPGSVVVTPGTVVRVDNQDLFAHELYAVRSGQTEPVVPAEVTSSRTTREMTFREAGLYVLQDVRQPTFRCWVLAGPGQGRLLQVAQDGSFRVPEVGDGDYTIRAYYEGTERTHVTVHVAGREAQAQLSLGGAGGATPPAGQAAGAPGGGADQQPSGRHGRRH
jgi:hypothetical protein